MTQTRLKKHAIFSLFITLILMQISCTKTDLSKENLIPKPVSIVSSGGIFELTDLSAIYVSGETEQLKNIGQFLADKLKPATGFTMEVKSSSEIPSSGNIYLKLSDQDASLGDEGYELNITANLITITANQTAGLFYGIQTLRQLLPSKIEMKCRLFYQNV